MTFLCSGIRSEELSKEVAQLVGNAGSYIKTRAMQQPIMSSMPPMMNMPSGSNGPPPVSVVSIFIYAYCFFYPLSNVYYVLHL